MAGGKKSPNFASKRSAFSCDSTEQLSTRAVRLILRSGETVDEAGRTRVIGVVTDPNGGLANGVASVQSQDTRTWMPRESRARR